MAYSGLGWSRKGGFQKPTLSGMRGAAGAIGGGIGGAALGGAAVIGGALARSTGATTLLAGLGVMGAGAVAGYKKFAAPKKEEDKEDKKDTNEELKQTAAYGLLSVEKLDAIYNNVVDIREHLSDQDPVSQEREKALDAKVKNKELVDAIRGIGGGGAGGGGTKKNFDWAKILGLGALAGLGGLAFMNDDKLNKFFDKAPEWADSIQLAIENIMEFVRDLDGFFEGLGIEFGGAAAAGIGAGLRATNNRNRNARLARAAAAAEEKKKKARAKRDEARRNKQNAKAAARAAARARAAAKAAERAKIKEEARKARAERRRQRAQKLKTAAAKIKARYTASMSRIGGRPGGAPAKPSTTTAGQKTATAKRGGRIARGFGAAFKVMQRNKARVQQALLNERAETKRQAKESRQQKSQTRAGRIKNVAQVAASKFIAKMPRIGGRPSGSPVKPSATSAATKVSTPRRGPGRIKRGLAALTPIAKKLFGGRSTGMGGRAASSFPKIPTVTPNIMGRSSGAGGRLASDFPEVKPITQGAGQGRPGGAPTKPKIPPKLALALKVLPPWAFKVAAQAGKAMGMVGAVATSKTAEYVLRIAGPIILAYEIFRLGQAWADAPGDKNPFGDEPADIAFKQGMLRLGATYSGGYFGAVAGGMMAGMLAAGNPLAGVAGAILGGIGGAIAGDKLMERFLMTDEQKREKELNEKKTRLQFLKDNPVKLRLRGGGAAKAVKEARIKEMRQLQEEISVLEAAGSLDGAGSVTVINNNSSNQSSNISMSGVSTTTIVDAHQDGTAIYDQPRGTARF